MKSSGHFSFAHWTRRFLAVALVLSVSACGDLHAPPSAGEGFLAQALVSQPRSDFATQKAAPTDSLVFNPHQKLVASDGTAGDELGSAVAVTGTFAFVGAAADDVNGPNSGSVVVFERTGGVYTQIQRLVASDGAADDFFGLDVAAFEDTLIVGAKGHSSAQFAHSGAAYVFVRNGNVWTEQAKLVASDEKADAAFGWKVAISEDTALVGAPWDDANGFHSGAAYVFARNAGSWSQQQELVATDGAPDDQFGDSLALEGPIAMIGAPYDDDLVTNSGSVYGYQRINGIFLAVGKLFANDAQADDHFGHGGVALYASYEEDALYYLSAAVGAPDVDVELNADQGALYVFDLIDGNLVQTQKLVASDGNALDRLGLSVAIQWNAVIAGAPGGDVGSNVDQGAVYVFGPSNGLFAEQQKIVAADGAANDHFGFSVAVYGDSLVAGAIHDDDVGSEAGSAYVFIAPGAFCFTNAACLTGFCVDFVCCNSACGGWATDDCVACSVDAGGQVNGTCSTIAAGWTCGLGNPEWVCYEPEICDGVSPACPENVPKPASTVCRPAVSDCDVDEFCNGISALCPDNVIAPAGTLCRAIGGPCDIPETCNGIFAYCPFDDKLAGTICRPSADLCDVAESCDGMQNECPMDAFVPANTLCRDASDICDVADRCSGSSAECTDKLAPDGTQCRPSLGDCDAAEVCNGLDADCPLDSKQPAGTACRMSNTPCDVTETCDGINDNCPADQKVSAGTECRPAAGPCDATETCDGDSNTCPPDVKIVFGTTICRESVAPCDIAEQCNGSSNDCPADEDSPNGTPCAGGICSNGVCSMGTAGSGGIGGGNDQPSEEAGCSCSIPGAANNGHGWGMFAMFCAYVMRACRRRSASRAS